MYEHVSSHLAALEANPAVASRADAFRGLRGLGLEDFGDAMFSFPLPEFPKLSRLLPAMAPADVQKSWTGSIGRTLLAGTLAFVRSLAFNFTHLTGRSLDGATVLDFGCGYGRIARLMYFFVAEERLWACDPWDKSLELCRESGLTRNFVLSQYLPESLPVGNVLYDLIFAFSVFTHLSRRAALQAMSCLRKYVKTDGVVAITVRPVEYWRFAEKEVGKDDARTCEVQHRSNGFAFRPHQRSPIDEDITYGDASISVDWLRANLPAWRVERIDRSLTDELQLYVFLRPA